MFYYFQVQSKVKLICAFLYTHTHTHTYIYTHIHIHIHTTQARKLIHLITELLSDTGDTHTKCISYILGHYDISWFPIQDTIITISLVFPTINVIILLGPIL